MCGSPSTVCAAAAGVRAASTSRKRLAPRPGGMATAAQWKNRLARVAWCALACEASNPQARAACQSSCRCRWCRACCAEHPHSALEVPRRRYGCQERAADAVGVGAGSRAAGGAGAGGVGAGTVGAGGAAGGAAGRGRGGGDAGAAAAGAAIDTTLGQERQLPARTAPAAGWVGRRALAAGPPAAQVLYGARTGQAPARAPGAWPAMPRHAG